MRLFCRLLIFTILPFFFFFFNDTATTEIYTLSLHDALPIYGGFHRRHHLTGSQRPPPLASACGVVVRGRSEEHTSELQSRGHLVCRLLLEKKKKKEKKQHKVTQSQRNMKIQHLTPADVDY